MGEKKFMSNFKVLKKNSFKNPKVAGYGGLLKGSNGEWVDGFSCHMAWADN